MTFEHKIIVGLNDIKAVILECTDQENKGCHARFSASPDMIQIPAKCPLCNATWWKGDRTFRQYENLHQMTFLELLAKLRDREADGAPFRILLELDDTERKPL